MTAATVPSVHVTHGTLFYLGEADRPSEVVLAARAPFEDILATAGPVTGYLAYDPAAPHKGLRGSLRVPVGGIDTGIDLRNDHLCSEIWLDAERYPEVHMLIQDSIRVLPVRETSTFLTHDMTLVGSLSLHGRTRRLEVPARVTWLRHAGIKRHGGRKELLAVRTRFKVGLRDYGITGGLPGRMIIGRSFSESIDVEAMVFGSPA